MLRALAILIEAVHAPLIDEAARDVARQGLVAAAVEAQIDHRGPRVSELLHRVGFSDLLKPRVIAQKG